MKYLSSKNKSTGNTGLNVNKGQSTGNNMQSKPNQGGQQSGARTNPQKGEFVNRKNGSGNGYQAVNRGKNAQDKSALLAMNKNNAKNQNNLQDNAGNDMKAKMQQIAEKRKKEMARKAIVTGLKAYNPAIGAAADKLLKTKKGDKLLDAYAKGDTPQQGIKNVAKILERDARKKAIIGLALTFALPFLLLLLLLAVVFKNADSQIYSNENGGTVESENYQFEDPDINIFKNYPGLYEKVDSVVKKISDEYQIEVDKYLIIATLIAPINNELIIPVNDGSCGEENCYYFKGESKTWTEFVAAWADQAELLAKMQILTYTNNQTDLKVNCGSEQTMEQYAKNDLETNTFPWYGWFNPVNWFKGFRDAVGAEVNAVCTEVPNGKTDVPTVRTLSTEQAIYYVTNNKDNEYVFEKDPNSGGVYFWNLVNKNGFLHEYLKDYLSDQYADDPDKNYEINKRVIVDTANYIYSYYQSIRKDCEGHKVIESTIEKIKIYNPPEKQSTFGLPVYQEIDFEEQYLGGVMLAEYNSGPYESLKAFAILARTEAVAVVGLDGEGTIENSSNAQNYNPNYSPEKYPEIAKAVAETRGIVISHYQSPKVWHTEYDAFCPQKVTLENGFYYLPEGQQELPISPSAYEQLTGSQFINPDSRYLKCPCFKNAEARPKTQEEATGEAAQDICWIDKDGDGITNYKPTGGHGRGASQYGLKYFGAFGYDQDALIRLFFPDANLRVLSSTLQNNKCNNIPYYTGEINSGTGNGDANYSSVEGGTALNKTLTNALSDNGYTVSDLNKCIGNRVTAKGMGTRDGVVEAGMSLLECTMNMTGGYTYPYDHRGGYIGGDYNPDIQGKLGVNSKWGEYASYATGCSDEPCRLGLNCANFVRWSMCNGGMDLCSKGSTFATGMAGVNSSEDYFPGAIRVRLTPSFSVLSGNSSISSREQAISMIKPGDVLYSDRDGSSNHVMLIVGVSSDSITIAENGRRTRTIKKSELSSNSMTYVVLLLDGYYSNASNKNNLTW